ncbi:MAG: M16 family metallopeptidase [Bacteroidia bacterium]
MINYKKHQLANGLKIITHFDNSTPIVAFNLLYNVGARDEHPEKTGFAHLFEHLMFGGSVNIPNFDEPLQRVGGENNAFTNNDVTNYYITLPKENVETAFWLESDRMLSLAFSEKSLEVQRNVVIEEFRQRYLNQPYGDVWLHLRPLAYKIHPYQWATIGKEISHIENATMQDVKDFFYSYYRPNNAILVVAGNIEHDEVVQLSEKWFGNIPAGEIKKRVLPQEPKQTEARKLTLERDVPANAIYKAYHICKRTDDDFYVFDLISDLLSRGNSSRFYQSLIKEQKLFSEIDAYVTGDFDPGLFVISGKLADGVNYETAENAILKEIEKLQTQLINNKDLQKLKNNVESHHVFGQMSVLNKAMALAFAELMGDIDLVNKEVDKYNAITSQQIKDISTRFLIENNCSTLYYKKTN